VLLGDAGGHGLPWLLDRLGFDPAFGSGPLATVVQDLLSVVMLSDRSAR
jgi:Mg/Co/Ni transporter MgtE